LLLLFLCFFFSFFQEIEVLDKLQDTLVKAVLRSPKTHDDVNLALVDKVMLVVCDVQREMKLPPYLHLGKRWAPPGCRFRTATEPSRLTSSYLAGKKDIWEGLEQEEDVAAFTEKCYREAEEREHPEVVEEEERQPVVEEQEADIVPESLPSSSGSGLGRSQSRKRHRIVSIPSDVNYCCYDCNH
jgi:hypothetical protein